MSAAAIGKNHWTSAIDFSSETFANAPQPSCHANLIDESSTPVLSPSGSPHHWNSSQPIESKVRSYRMSSPVVFQRVLANLNDDNNHKHLPSIELDPSSALSDPFEAFLMRRFVEDVAPLMNLYAFDSVFTHILPWLALHERVLFDSIMAISAWGVHAQRPGSVSRDIPEQYKMRALAAIRDNLETSPYYRKLLHLCSSLIILLYNILASDTTTLLVDLNIAYHKIKELFVGRPPASSQNDGPNDLFPICVGLSFSLDLVVSFRFDVCCCWEPDFLQAIFENERLPRSYTNEWWLQMGFLLLVRINHFTHRCHVPTYQEYLENARLAEWTAIYNDLLDYGRLLPQPLRPMAQIPSLQGTFPSIHVFDEYSMLANVTYHTGVIMALHVRPGMTLSELVTVPPGTRDHAIQIMGLLKTCDKPFFWITIYWAHKSAASCITDQTERDEALELSCQYEWQTGFTFEMHLKAIQSRWTILDTASIPQPGGNDNS